MQSVIDNLRSPKTIEQLCEKTVLTTGEVRLCLRELEEEGSLVVDGDHYLVL
jgi:DNA-binding IclR family transcriptional regulator